MIKSKTQHEIKMLKINKHNLLEQLGKIRSTMTPLLKFKVDLVEQLLCVSKTTLKMICDK